MSFILQRIRRIEKLMPQAPNDAIVWVHELSRGRYRVERPEYIKQPYIINRVPEDDFGKIVNDAYLEKYAVVIIESDGAPLRMTLFHN